MQFPREAISWYHPHPICPTCNGSEVTLTRQEVVQGGASVRVQVNLSDSSYCFVTYCTPSQYLRGEEW